MTWTAKQQAIYDRATVRGYHHFNHDGICCVCGQQEDLSRWSENGWALARAHAHHPFSLRAIRVAFFLFRVLAAPLVIFLGMCDGIPPGRMWRRFNDAADALENHR